MARLSWSLELSRLAIFRIVPKARVQQIVKAQLNCPSTEWIFVDEGLRCFIWAKGSEQSKIYSLNQNTRN